MNSIFVAISGRSFAYDEGVPAAGYGAGKGTNEPVSSGMGGMAREITGAFFHERKNPDTTATWNLTMLVSGLSHCAWQT